MREQCAELLLRLQPDESACGDGGELHDAGGDGYITAAPTANQTLTLPDCTGQSGAVYTVTNLQSAFTVGVVAGSSSQLINGLAVGTAVRSGEWSLTLRDVPNPKTVSGCHWEM